MGIGDLASDLMIKNVNDIPIFNENKDKLERWNLLYFEKWIKCNIITFCEGGCVAMVLRKKDLEFKCSPYYYNCDEYIRGYVKYAMLKK